MKTQVEVARKRRRRRRIALYLDPMEEKTLERKKKIAVVADRNGCDCGCSRTTGVSSRSSTAEQESLKVL